MGVRYGRYDLHALAEQQRVGGHEHRVRSRLVHPSQRAIYLLLVAVDLEQIEC